MINILLGFITSASRVVEGVKNGDNELVDSSTVEWYQSADSLAEFFAQINSFWDVNQWRNLLYQYVKASIEEIVAIASGNYEQEITIYNRLQDLSYILGSYMARGIIARSTSIPNPFLSPSPNASPSQSET